MLPEQPSAPDPAKTPESAEAPERRRSWADRLAAVRERPFGRLAVGLAAVLALASSDQVSAQEYETRPEASSVDIVLDDGSNLHFDDWHNAEGFDTQESAGYIEPSAALMKVITTQHPYSEILGLTPPQIENPATFAKWTAEQASRTDLSNALGNRSEPTPRQLVDLSTSIVIANVDYNDDVRTGHSSYKEPMDKNLEEGNKLQCEGYSTANVAVFDELKRQHPDELKNTYMVTHSGQDSDKAHMWNMVVRVMSPTEAEASFIDPSGDDPSYDDLTGWRLGPVDLLEGLNDKGALSNTSFHLLIDTYRQTNPQADEIASMDKDQDPASGVPHEDGKPRTDWDEAAKMHEALDAVRESKKNRIGFPPEPKDDGTCNHLLGKKLLVPL